MPRLAGQGWTGEAWGMRTANKFLIGAAIGSGSTALAAERGGADFLLALNAGRLRNMGAPSIACMLPILNAARLTEAFAREELLPQCRIPVFLGVDVWDETFDPAGRAAAIREAGFAGAVNFPSCMHYSRPMRQILGRAGRGIEAEVEQLRAVQEAGLTSMFYCATRTQARLAADAGIHLVLLNLGWNVGGAVGHRSRETLEEAATRARDIGRLIKRINPKTRFFLEGGPVATAEDLARVAGLAPIDGYVGGSTIERMPLETSIADQIGAFRRAVTRGSAVDEESAALLAWGKRLGFVGRSGTLVGFLRRLRALAAARHPLLLTVEPGGEARWALDAIASPRAPQRGHGLSRIDLAGEDYPARAGRRLFGAAGADRAPALADPAVSLLAIQAPERLSAGLQRRLARALREGTFRSPGSSRPLKVAPRVVLMTECRADSEPGDAGLDAALIELLGGWVLKVPPLRARIEDLEEIIDAAAAELGLPALTCAGFGSETLQRLHAHLWPGNELELRGLLGALAGRERAEPVRPEEIAPLLDAGAAGEPDRRSEKDRIVDGLWRNGFNRSRTAEALGMSRKTLYNKIRKYGLAG